ncbi:MAG TPA: transglutaminase domain-containing protein, partial [Verrucomicrobiae bacterium]|nr:transglutaminase domain-containing protein [Verrucomicrobiae bacterium]
YRSRRGGLAPWAAAMAIAIAAGYFGQAGLSRLQKYVENLNVFWFAGGGSRKGDAAETRMAIGKIGRIQNSSSILVRLETVGHSPAPSLLREGSYRIYREGSQSWVSGDVADEFTQVGESNETSYLLVPGKQDHGKVSISCFLPGGKGLLPVPQPVSRLDRLFVFNLQRSPGAALLAEGPGFVSFDANYGPGLSVDAPPILDNDLAIPPGELPGIQEAAGQIKLIGTNRLQILDSVAGFFAANFSYTNYQENPADAAVSQNSRRYGYNYGYHRGSRPAGTAAAAVAVRADGLRSSRDPLTRTNAGPENSLFRQYGFGAGFGGTNFWNSHRYRERILEMAERSRRGETPLSRFLLKTRRGHCEYFATATVLLLRSFGIPARYAVGYSVHEHSGDEYVVRGRDAHAWCLVWNAQSKAWENFDTTPATWVGIEDARASPFRGLLDVWSDVKFGLARIWWGQGNFRRYLLYALLPALGLLFGHIVFRGRRTRRRRAGESRENFSRPGLDSEFYMLEKKLGQRGLRRPAAKPVAVWMREMLAEPELAALREPLEKLLELHYRYRFDPAGLSAPEREILRREARQCAASL